jgi:hypothetical protein
MNWQGDPAAPEFAPLIQAVRRLLGSQSHRSHCCLRERQSATPRSRVANESWLVDRRCAVRDCVAGAFAVKNSFQKAARRKVRPMIRQETSQPASSPSTTATPPAGAGKAITTQGAFAIKLGDKSPTEFRPGAGIYRVTL